MYSISVRQADSSIKVETSAEILSALRLVATKGSDAEKAIAAIERLERDGSRYSNCDFDTLSHARHALWEASK